MGLRAISWMKDTANNTLDSNAVKTSADYTFNLTPIGTRDSDLPIYEQHETYAWLCVSDTAASTFITNRILVKDPRNYRCRESDRTTRAWVVEYDEYTSKAP